ncbi:MAG: alpha-L-fucosidase [Planctomycetaceae bacterium]|jgi:alpha-L-fucosidase|nr:alpha-L-fucosidase [Planctomycetaceae bacterium]
MKKSFTTILLVCVTFLSFSFKTAGFAFADEPATIDETKYPRCVLPSPEQVLWQNMEQIVFVCIDPCTWQNREYDDLSTPLEKINPTKLDVNQWIDAAEAFDAKMILFVAKHTGGFCWWQTETTDYSIKNTPYKNGQGDVLDELAKACFKRGMKLGIYISPQDVKNGVGVSGKAKNPENQEKYNKILRQQWEEVLSRYNNQIAEIWFDGSVIVPLEDIVKKYSPRAIVLQGPFTTIRWVGNERGICPYPNWYTLKSKDAKTGTATAQQSDPNGDVWMPVEVDTTSRNHFWFWSTTNENKLRSRDQLMDIYYQSVGRGGLLLLNSTPDTSGLIPEKDMTLYRNFGNEIRQRFGKSVAETSGKGSLVELRLSKATLIDHAIIQEEISMGQRVRKYEIEGLIENQWKILAQGQSVGQKRIEKFVPIKVDAVRLRVTEFSYPPIIKRFAVFNTGGTAGGQVVATENKSEKDAGEIRLSDDGQFEFDLSPFIPFAEQYVLRIKIDSQVVPVEKISLQIQGIDQPNFITINNNNNNNNNNNEINLNITAAPDMKPNSIVIRGKLKQKNVGKYRLSVQ